MPTHSASCFLLSNIPPALEGLVDLALDMRWSWSHVSDVIWQQLDGDLWERTRNPWLILQSVSESRLARLAEDAAFVALVQQQLHDLKAVLATPGWFQRQHDGVLQQVAYFSMEFGLSEALPIYSGGLGILAGDCLKTASDLGVPLIGVGLLYQQGYFRQALGADGSQREFFPYNNPAQLPVTPVRDAQGEWLRVSVHLPGRELRLQVWQVVVGRVHLYLLDSNDPLNLPADRGITGELYGGGWEMRLQQEMVLGIGGWRVLHALGKRPEVCHLNEGHAAFAVLERAADFARENHCDFSVALNATRAGNLFTTHTPVAAGFDCFSPALIRQYFDGHYQSLGLDGDALMALGRPPEGPDGPFNMAWLAVHGSAAVNGVSRLHGEVSRRIFQPLFPRWPRVEVPVSHVTNGVHVPSWDSTAADAFWTRHCGKDRWLGELETLEETIRQQPAEAFWDLRALGRQQLVDYVRGKLAEQRAESGAPPEQVEAADKVLDHNALTLGFARRFAEYKRPNLLLTDPERLARLLRDAQRPVQLVIAGKAHPQDNIGKAMVHAWNRFIEDYGLQDKVVFLSDYDMLVAEQLVQGADLWINTPRRPWEACGTSGMKVLVNGGINLSELDGWWAEAYSPAVGWALGDGREHGPEWDAHEAEALYQLLEEEVVPSFYRRDEHGIPREWVARIQASSAELTPRFSSNRMLREYVEQYYLTLAEEYRRRSAEGGRLAAEIEDWRRAVSQHWDKLRFGDLTLSRDGELYRFRLQAYLDDLSPEMVQVELYAEPQAEGEAPERIVMRRIERLAGAMNSYLYAAETPAQRPAGDYTPRLVPHHPAVKTPLELPLIRWMR